MYVKEVVINGFKSYSQRTVVSGFDPSFNAITGLNGSGKSNILDSICFVLGISNLSQVRAKELQDLVYKQGNAGIKKATVTITFDNSDKNQCPVGYEHYEEISVTRSVVIGGRNKYLINGVVAQPTRVQNLFHSVQLNVNNPHFLIMQGRITKVLNMKPPEILSMIEEAAGTRLFETKKLAAEKTMEKKDKKVEEIDRVLREEITPTLERLREEQKLFVKWQGNKNEIEKLRRLCVAHQFLELSAKVESAAEELSALKGEAEEAKTHKKNKEDALARMKTELKELNDKKAKEYSEQFKHLEVKVADLSKELVKYQTVTEHKKENVQAEQTNVNGLEASIKESQQSIAKLEKNLEKKEKEFEKIHSKQQQLSQKIENDQQQYQALSMGKTEGEDTSLNDQLNHAQRQLSESSTSIKQAEMKLKHLKGELKEKSKDCKTAEKEMATLTKDIGRYTKEIEKLQKVVDTLGYDPEKEEGLVSEKRSLEKEIMQVRERADILSAQLAGMDFKFDSPSKGFDRKRVKGLVAKLLKVKDSSASSALEVVAGGKLYNVVVDTEDTGKQLLKGGNLQRRVTIIPLNKIDARTIPSSSVKAAEQCVGKDNVNVAIELVGYDKDVEKAMQYVFGSTMVCKDIESAKQVTFNKNVRTRTVTLDGDLFDPAGTLTGGSKPSGGSVLQRLDELASLETKLAQLEAKLRRVSSSLEEMRALADRGQEARRELELKTHELQLLKDRIAQTSASQLIATVQSLEEQIEGEQEHLNTAKENEKKWKSEAKSLEKQIEDFSNNREKKMKAMEKQLAKDKEALSGLAQSVFDGQQEVETVRMEKEGLQEEIKSLEEQVQSANEVLDRVTAEYEAAAEQSERSRGAYVEVEKELSDKKAELNSHNSEANRLSSDIASVEDEVEELGRTVQTKEKAVSRHGDVSKENANRVDKMLKDYPWIQNQKQFFGQEGTDFDFHALKPSKAAQMLKRCEDDQKFMEKKINKKVMGMFEKAEQEYQDFMCKKETIEKDKSKIMQVIEELEEKKNEALKTTWAKVNKDFGSIFSTLLPGTQAKLEPPEGGSVLDGLEVKVAFGHVWKQSLTELSGGQRSLLALSLILSLLMFKPAPMYILDEIDAALDLSHTQNIGQMLRSHFSHSQFIVVSLKEGMFNNANVLFKTKFVDGQSTVQRIAHHTAAPLNTKEKNASENALASAKGKKRSGATVDRRALSEVN